MASTPHPGVRDRRPGFHGLVALCACVLSLAAHPLIALAPVSLALIFAPAERLIRARRQVLLRPGVGTDIVHMLVSTALTGLGLVGVGALAIWGRRRIVPREVVQLMAHQPGVARWAEAFVIAMICGYWAHRLSHRLPLLWRFHSIHHSSETLDWLAGARFHPVDQIVTRGAGLVPLLLLGFGPATFGAYLAVDGILGIAVHANIRIPLGPLSLLLPNPRFHSWHHSADPVHYNSNYSGYPLVDLLFGTAHLPADEAESRFGSGERGSSWAGQMLSPFGLR